MHRRRTIGETRWLETPDFVAIATIWRKDASMILLSFVWQAYDLLLDEVLSDIDFTQIDDELERSMTQYLEQKIHRFMTGDEPFEVQHGPYEYETRMEAPAQPPQYDIAFILNQNPRIMWPLEAKVLQTDGAIADYVNAIQDNFLTCRYAPFSSEAGMLGYLLSGEPSKMFSNIETKLPCALHDHPVFPNRNHKISEHRRMVQMGKAYPENFRCHHMIFRILGSVTSTTS